MALETRPGVRVPWHIAIEASVRLEGMKPYGSSNRKLGERMYGKPDNLCRIKNLIQNMRKMKQSQIQY